MSTAEYAARCAAVEAELEAERLKLGLSPTPAPVVGVDLRGGVVKCNECDRLAEWLVTAADRTIARFCSDHLAHPYGVDRWEVCAVAS